MILPHELIIRRSVSGPKSNNRCDRRTLYRLIRPVRGLFASGAFRSNTKEEQKERI